MQNLGKILILGGIVAILVGLVLVFTPRIPFLGKLPGDILVKRDNFTFYFPLATSIIISLLVSLILYLIKRFSQ